jgi:peptidoglycan/xylan/chitin deacetylase (PgdA/CDA1 family)
MAGPIISFSFDDAPRSAFRVGGGILESYNARATYYVTLGLLGLESPGGVIASADDLRCAKEAGHDLGCHTYDHCEPWDTPTEDFVKSIKKNQSAIADILPGFIFSTFAYPLDDPCPSTKRRVGELFTCCRGGGQIYNKDTADLNLLKAYFLDRRNRNDKDAVIRMIDENTACRGWLIFATHDVADNPSPYGCTPDLFKEVVEYATHSDASVLTVTKAFDRLDRLADKNDKEYAQWQREK